MNRLIQVLFTLLLIISPGGSLAAQSREEFRTQIFSYFRDERISQALITARQADRAYPDDPFFRLLRGVMDQETLLFPHLAPDRPAGDIRELAEYAEILIGLGGRFSGAGLELYRQLAERYPEDLETLFRYALNLYRSGEPEAVARAVDLAGSLPDAPADDPISAAAARFRALAGIIRAGGAPGPAELRVAYPEFLAEKQFLRGLAANSIRTGACAAAVEYLETAVGIDPWDPGLRRLQAEALGCAGDRDRAAAASDRASSLARDREALDSISLALQAGNRREAAHGLQLLLSESPGFLEAARMLARLQAEDGNRIGAATVYENYLAVFPDDSAARDRAASLLLEEGRYDQASILVADRPVTEKGRLVSACQMIRGSNWQEAEAILRDIIISNPLDPMVIIQLSRCLAARRAFAEARALLDKGRKANPGYPALENEVNAVEFAYATHLSETGNLKEALAYYRRLVKLEPDNPRYLLNLGHAEMMNGEFSLAISHFRKGLKLTPGEDWARSGLAYSLMREWDFDGAIREMKLLLAKGDDPDYLLQLGSMYNQIGNTREGWALIRKAARLGHPEAARLVRERYGDQP